MPLVPSLGGTLQMVETPLGPMAVETLGVGPTVVLLHAITPIDCRDEWRELAQRLAAAGYRVVAPDLPGFGDSPTQPQRYTAEALIQALDGWLPTQAPAVVVARGDAVAYMAACCADAERFPVLIAIAPLGAEHHEPSEAMYREYLGRSHSPEWEGIKSLTELVFGRWLDLPETRREPGLSELPPLLARQPHWQHLLASFWGGYLHRDARLDWIALTQPILLLWGEGGGYPPLDDATTWLMPLRPNAPPMMIQGEPVGVHKQNVFYKTFKDTADWPHVEAPDAVAHVIVGWLRRLGWGEAAEG